MGTYGQTRPRLLQVGTAELATVRAVARLLQGDDWDYNAWAARQVTAYTLQPAPLTVKLS